jgi:DNA replication protein DnaD
LPKGTCKNKMSEFLKFDYERPFQMKSSRIIGIIISLAICVGFLGASQAVRAADEVTKEADKAGKSIQNTVRQTGNYLKSDAFHKDLKKFTDGVSNAIKKGGNWFGRKIDSLSKPDSKSR